MRMTAIGLALGLTVSTTMTATAGTFSIGVENIDYMPQYAFADGEYRGFARALLDAFARDSGNSFEYRALPVARLFAEFVAGSVDFKYPDNALWSADLKKGHEVVYSTPVVSYIDGVSVLPSRAGKGADGLKVLGTVRGFTAWDWLDRINAGQVKLNENNSFSALLQQALIERVDGAYANVAVVNYQLGQMNKPAALVYDPALPHTAGAYHLSTIRHPELVAAFNAWMSDKAAAVAKLKADYAVEQGVR